MKRKREIQSVEKHALGEGNSGPDHSKLTPAERIALTCELSRAAIALREGTDVLPRLDRSVISVRPLRG